MSETMQGRQKEGGNKFGLKRSKLVNKMASLIYDDIREREAMIGLTVGHDFQSMYAKIKAER